MTVSLMQFAPSKLAGQVRASKPLTLALPCAAQLKQDIEFSKPGGVSLTLDAYVPPGPGPFPTAIIVHGGGWVNGTKTTYVPPLFPPLTKAGFVWFTTEEVEVVLPHEVFRRV